MFVARRPDGGLFGAEQRQAMIAALRAQPAGTTAWFAAPGNDPAAVARAEALRSIWIAAGWAVPEVQRLEFQPRDGLLLLAADDPPAPSVGAVAAALDAAGLEVRVRAGYRAFVEHQRATGSSGPLLALAPDQAFVLVVGRE